jgi:predicted nucleic acid-binding protein
LSAAVYLDSSALVKLVVAESESEALQRFLRNRRIRVTSSLAKVEVRRAVRFQGKPADDRVTKVLARIRLLTIDNALLDAAAALDAAVLRSLDAIHLASAMELGDDLDCVVTYDRRMSDAASVLGLVVRAPGAVGDVARRRAKKRVRKKKA